MFFNISIHQHSIEEVTFVEMQTVLLIVFFTIICGVQSSSIDSKIDVPGNATEASSNCGGNCPAGNCPKCPCGSTMNYVDIISWCSKYTGWNQVRISIFYSPNILKMVGNRPIVNVSWPENQEEMQT
jgi:hypothetical protein